MTIDTDAYGDSYFLAQRDKTINDFRESDKNTKRKIIEKMLTLRHNMKYNKHLLSVYLKAKSLFDTMIEEHRAQLHSLDEIYRHLNHIIRENLTTQKNKNKNIKNAGITTPMMAELVKDKKRIGALLKKMRDSFNKLMDIDTVIGVTIAQINEITFMEDHDSEGKAEDDDDDSEDEEDEDDEDEDDEDEAEADEDDESEGEDDDSEADEGEDEAEAEAEAEADESEDDEDSEAEAEADEAEDEGEDEDEADDAEADDDDAEADDDESEEADDDESEEADDRDQDSIIYSF